MAENQTLIPPRESAIQTSKEAIESSADLETRILHYFCSGAIFLLYALVVLFYDGHEEPDERAIFLCIFFVFPVAAAALGQVRNPWFTLILLWNGGILIALLSFLLLGSSVRAVRLTDAVVVILGWNEMAWLAVVHLFGFLLVLHPAVRKWITLRVPEERSGRVVGWMLVLTPFMMMVFFAMYSSWDGILSQSVLGRILMADLRLALFLLFTTALTGAVLVLGRFEARLAARRPSLHRRLGLAMLGFAILFAALLFDDSLVADPAHYMTLVGPALHVMHGGIPMVDAFSQYGFLPFVLFYFAFQWLPANFETTALVEHIFTTAYLVSFVVLVFRLTRHKAITSVLAMAGLIVFVTFHHPHILWFAPSSGGLRYFMPMLMVLSLSFLRPWQRHSFWTLSVITAASFFSLETFVYSFAAYAAFLVGMGLLRRSPLLPVRGLLLITMTIGLVHSLLAGLWWLRFGSLPRYDIYLEIPFGLMFGRLVGWSQLISSHYWDWALFATVHFLALAYFLRRVLLSRRNALEDTDWWLVSRLLPMVAIGVMFGLYFVGRSVAVELAYLPLFVVGIAMIERLILNSSTVLHSRRSLTAVVILTIGIMAGFSLEIFARPYLNHSSNGSILRQCFSQSGCAPGYITGNLMRRIMEPISSRLAREEPLIRDGYYLVDKYFPGKERVTVLLDQPAVAHAAITTTILIYAGKWHQWPISNILSDQLSPTLSSAILEYSSPLGDGDIVISYRYYCETGENRLGLGILQSLFDSITNQWQLKPLEVMESGVAAYRLRPLEPENPHQISIRYPIDVEAHERMAMEAQYKLEIHRCSRRDEAASEPERRTWFYALLDISSSNITALLQDRRVEDATGIDPRKFVSRSPQ